LYNNTISEIKVKLKGDNERQMRYLEGESHSTAGKIEFHMDENSDFTNLLKRVYGVAPNCRLDTYLNQLTSNFKQPFYLIFCY